MKREGIKSVIFFVLGVGMVSLMLVASGTANAQKPSNTPPVTPVERPSGAFAPPIEPPARPAAPQTGSREPASPLTTPPVCQPLPDCLFP